MIVISCNHSHQISPAVVYTPFSFQSYASLSYIHLWFLYLSHSYSHISYPIFFSTILLVLPLQTDTYRFISLLPFSFILMCPLRASRFSYSLLWNCQSIALHNCSLIMRTQHSWYHELLILCTCYFPRYSLYLDYTNWIP